MNVLFSLTPKSEVAYLYDDYSLRQALEKMEHYRYSAVPVIDRNGCYVGTLTEGDLSLVYKRLTSLSRSCLSVGAFGIPVSSMVSRNQSADKTNFK